jgi:hypothetical protein
MRFLAVGYSRITLLYAFLTLPAYLYLEVPKELLILLTIYTLLTGYALFARRGARYLAELGSFLAIATLPVVMNLELSCSQLQFLPWLFNGLIGAVFFATLLIRNSILKWIPIAIFYGLSTALARQLPNECSRLLDGSIPAIFLILIIAMALGYARRRDLTFEARLISDSKSEAADIEKTRREVLERRADLISRLSAFARDLSDSPNSNLLRKINSIILLTKSFLLTSQHFQSHFAISLYELSLRRFIAGSQTVLNVNTVIEDVNLGSEETDHFFSSVENVFSGKDITITISGTEHLDVAISSTDGSSLPEFHYSADGISAKAF